MDKSRASRRKCVTAWIMLIVMASVSIYHGAFRSSSNLQKFKISGERATFMTFEAAALTPLISSVFLLFMYLTFELSAKLHSSLPNYVKVLLKILFLISNFRNIERLFKSLISKCISHDFQVLPCQLLIRVSDTEIDLHFETVDIITFATYIVFSWIHLYNKNWMVCNIFGLAVAVDQIEYFYLNNVTNGCVFLGGLLIYDIFWVFGTNVMLKVADYNEAPIMLMFPSDLFENAKNRREYYSLGLGDIIIPGSFISLLLRFDEYLKRGQSIYFYSSLISYILGLLLAAVMCSYSRRGQPALLYIVPACIVVPGALAFIKGDLNALLQYRDYLEH